jgi:hypothetical protein
MVGVINVDLTAKSFPQFHDLASAATSVPPGVSFIPTHFGRSY